MKRFAFGLSVLLGSMMMSLPGYGQLAVDVYELPVVYPMQQEAVGEARMDIAEQTTDEGTLTRYTLYNNVLAASFVRSGGALMFGGFFDMQGRRLAAPPRQGVYICNGKVVRK